MTPSTLFRLAAVPALAIALAGAAQAQSAATPTLAKPVAMNDKTQTSHAIRASVVVGKDVNDASGKDIGKVKDLIVDVNTGDVRYAVLEFDPGFFKSDKLFAVPLKSFGFTTDDKPLTLKTYQKAELEKAGVDKKDWETAVDNRRYVEGLDKNYGYKPPHGAVEAMRASKILGKDVNNRAGKDIGDVKDLVLDMGANKVRYAVLAFDPSWFTGEKLFAFPLSAFVARDAKHDFMLDVDQKTLQSMKAFDSDRWSHLNDLDRDNFINAAPVARR